MIPEKVAMKISGHRIRSVFDRYNVTNEQDLKRISELVTKMHLETEKNCGRHSPTKNVIPLKRQN